MSVVYSTIDLQDMGADLNIIRKSAWHKSSGISGIYALVSIRKSNPFDKTKDVL